MTTTPFRVHQDRLVCCLIDIPRSQWLNIYTKIYSSLRFIEDKGIRQDWLTELELNWTDSLLILHVLLRMLALFWSFMEPDWQGLQLDTNSNSGYQERSHFQCFSLAIKCFYLQVTHVSSTHFNWSKQVHDQRVQKNAILLMCLRLISVKPEWPTPALPISSSLILLLITEECLPLFFNIKLGEISLWHVFRSSKAYRIVSRE